MVILGDVVEAGAGEELVVWGESELLAGTCHSCMHAVVYAWSLYGLEKTDNKTAGNEGCYMWVFSGQARGICTNQYDCILAKCLDFYRNCSFTMIKMHMVLCILQKQTKNSRLFLGEKQYFT